RLTALRFLPAACSLLPAACCLLPAPCPLLSHSAMSQPFPNFPPPLSSTGCSEDSTVPAAQGSRGAGASCQSDAPVSQGTGADPC
ncbi:unnamed protein product, partial [Closterium sp. NIES-54]